MADIHNYKKRLDRTLERVRISDVISQALGGAFPDYVIDFIENYCSVDDKKIGFSCNNIENWASDTDKEEIMRPRGFIRGNEDSHQFLILYNKDNKARLFYRPSTKKLGFLVNTRR